MKKLLKSNNFAILLLSIIALLFISNPMIYSRSCLEGVSVWATKVFPTLFPFFILSRLIVNLSTVGTNHIDKYFCKIYNAPNGSLVIFLLSAVSGYPMGAKLISTLYNDGKITNNDANKMLTFTSISGPMFMLGTVGVAILGSMKAGIVILISNILAGLLNGLLYRGKKQTKEYIVTKQSTNNLSDIVYDSLLSILMVGAFIVISYLIIELLTTTRVLTFISSTLSKIFHLKNGETVISSIITGLIEITRGAIDISGSGISLFWQTIISSTSIAFGGISIMLQTTSFLNRLSIPIKTMLKYKLSQAVICFGLSIILALAIL